MTEGLWALLGVVVGAAATGFFNCLLQKRQFEHSKEMFRLRNMGAENVKGILEDMLNHRSYTDRSFEALTRPIGGYPDSEVRQFLHEIGAKKVYREDGSEWWYLLSRQEERIQKREDA